MKPHKLNRLPAVLVMSDKFRQTLIGFIWPGPIAGPLPLNLFRITAPLLVFYTGPIAASLVMGCIAAIFSVIYLGLLQLTGGKEYVENWLRKLPKTLHQGVEKRGPIALFFTSLLTGPFAYAILLRLLRYSQTKSEILLIASAFVTSFIWTGIFWGTVVGLIRETIEIAF